ncbi:MAG: TolC family protein [Thermodesulfobacteriota bacterium]
MKNLPWLLFAVMVPLASVASRGLAATEAGSPPPLVRRIEQQPALRDLIEAALLHNPAIVAARHAWKGKIERYRVDTALADPELFSSYAVAAADTSIPMDWQIGLSQAFPFPGTLSRRGEVAAQEIAIARLRYQRALLQVAAQAWQAAAELDYIRQARRVAERNGDLLGRLLQLAAAAAGKDRGSLIDVAKAQSQAAQLQYDALLMAELETTETARLNAVLSRPAGAAVGPLSLPPSPPLSLELAEIQRFARENQQELLMAAAAVKKGEAAVRAARSETYPELRLGAFYSGSREDGAMAGEVTSKEAVGVQAGLSLPLWFGKNQGRVGEAEADLVVARADLRTSGNELDAQLSSVFFRIRNAERLLELYGGDLLPRAAAAVAAAESWFKAGQGSYADLVETTTVLYNFELALARARADREKFLAELVQLCGGDPTGGLAVVPAAADVAGDEGP